MPSNKLKFGKSSTEMRELEVEKQRKLEEEIRQRNQDQMAKIEAMKSAQTRNKIIIVSVFFVGLISLLSFGIINTFFKTPLTEDEVTTITRNNINYYPKESVRRYLVDNITELFKTYSNVNTSVYDYCKVDKNSVAITRVTTLSNTIAQVDFCVDVEYKEVDTPETNEFIIKRLKQNGLKTDQDIIDEYLKEHPTEKKTEATTQKVIEDTTEAVEPQSTDDTTSTESTEVVDTHDDIIPRPSPVSTKVNDVDTDITSTEANSEEITEAEVTTEEVTEENKTEEVTEVKTEEINTENATESSSEEVIIDTDKSSIEYATADDVVSYYVKDNKIYKKGRTFIKTYYFTIPIEYFTEGNIRGYKPCADMSLYSLENADFTDFSNIEINDEYYGFDKDSLVDNDILEAAKIKVNKTLEDLYTGRDVSQDFFNNYKFNTYGAKFISINSFELYTKDNWCGFNALVSYTIELDNGLSYVVHAYMKIEQSGESWIITKFM